MKKRFIEIYGWYGVGALIGAYALASFGFLSVSGILFQLLNATGALGIALVSFRQKANQAGVVNALWAAIAVIAMLRMFL